MRQLFFASTAPRPTPIVSIRWVWPLRASRRAYDFICIAIAKENLNVKILKREAHIRKVWHDRIQFEVAGEADKTVIFSSVF
ncbi:hypothetical protein SAMN04490206_1195 [Pseudomonas umsongensis]|nr:hypothetical protein SAMN04490206_1195 [Pseudomonas umsongensis]